MPAAYLKRAARKFNAWSDQNEHFLIFIAVGITAILAVRFEAFETMHELTQRYENYEADEIFSVLFLLGLGFIILFSRRTFQLRREVAKRTTAEAEAQSLARHDALTGLPNRRVLGSAIEQAIYRSSADSIYAVLLIDLDRFKPVNDIYGHAVGDAVLCVVAERFKGVMASTDTLARIGGDEFGAVIRSGIGGEAAMRVAQRLISATGEPIVVDGAKIEIGATIGIALCPQDGSDSESLLRCADVAMYRAKRDFRGTYFFFESGMDGEIRARSELNADLRQAIRLGEIKPHYQPLISLADNKLQGFEVLARWYHPTRGVVQPGDFISIAEDAGLITELSYDLLRQACNDVKNWPSHLTLSVNISPLQLRDRSLPQAVLAILVETGLAPGRLVIEITETALVADLETAKFILSSLQNLGVKIALDDFGTGYSSLHHLRVMHFDKVKLDRSFVQSMDDPESAMIVKAVISLGKSLGLATTAEGIESADHLAKLIELDCEVGQGYFFGKAVSATEVTQSLQDRASTGDLKRAVA